jgi:Putative adhesin
MATYVRHQEISHHIGPTGRLSVKLTDSDLRLRAAEGDEVHLRATFEISAGSDEDADRILEASKLIVSTGAASLDVRSQDGVDLGSLMQTLGIPNGATLRRWITGQPRVQLSIEVEAPASCDVRIETVSGDLVVQGMNGEQRYSTVSGDQYLTDLGGSLRINTVSGDATLRAVTPLRIRAESVSGDLSVIAPRLEEMRLTTVSGDLEIEGELGPRGEHRIETVSGDLIFGLVGDATFEVRGISTEIQAEMAHRAEGRMDRRRVVIGSGVPTVIFGSMSGDVSVRNPRRLERKTNARDGQEPGGSESLDVLRALERGEIDVDEAARRLGERPGHA